MHLKDGTEGKNLLSSQFLVHGKKEHVARQHGVAYRCQDLWQLFDAVFVALIHLRYLHFYGTVRKSCYCQDVIRAWQSWCILKSRNICKQQLVERWVLYKTGKSCQLSLFSLKTGEAALLLEQNMPWGLGRKSFQAHLRICCRVQFGNYSAYLSFLCSFFDCCK